MLVVVQAKRWTVVSLQLFRSVKDSVLFIVKKCFNVSIIVDGIILYSVIISLGPFEYIAIIFVLGPTTSYYGGCCISTALF